MAVAKPAAVTSAHGTISQAGEVRSTRVESLRALAALGVVIGHTFAIALTFKGIFDGAKNRVLIGGGLGVFLFLVLSGYLLFWPFARAQLAGQGRIDLRRYALNRALRILPLYYTVVLVVYLVQPTGAKPGDWWRFALFLENFSLSTIARLDSPIWSLVVEMQFYIVLPFIAYAIGILARGSIRRAALAVGALAMASFALRLDTVLLTDHPNYVGVLGGKYSLPSLFFFFATGMALALLRLAWERHRPSWVRGPLLSRDVWLLGSLPLWALSCFKYGWEPAIALAGFLTVGSCVLPLVEGRVVRALDWRPLAVLGVASYSLYLWHVPILLALAKAELVFRPNGAFTDVGPAHDFKTLLLIGLPLCCAVALVSYAIVEAPFLRLRRRWANPPMAPAAPAARPPAPALDGVER
jgi:peptidoglycan/LPS O-acetylase OafA/YrhL